MNIGYLIGLVLALAVMLVGMAFDPFPAMNFTLLGNFVDPSSIFIVIGCTLGIVMASFPLKTVLSIPKHFGILLKNPKMTSDVVINRLVDLAGIARKDGLLALEEHANQEEDPFFKQAIMLIVDANDPDRVRATLENDIECMSARHNAAAALYDKGSAVAPAFGMVGTLVGLINMLQNMDPTSGSSTIGKDMGVALITTLYGCVLAHMIFSPIANNLRVRDEDEVLLKLIIVEGITCIQAGENPKMLKEKLLTFVAQKQREKIGAGSGGGSGE